MLQATTGVKNIIRKMLKVELNKEAWREFLPAQETQFFCGQVPQIFHTISLGL